VTDTKSIVEQWMAKRRTVLENRMPLGSVTVSIHPEDAYGMVACDPAFIAAAQCAYPAFPLHVYGVHWDFDASVTPGEIKVTVR